MNENIYGNILACERMKTVLIYKTRYNIFLHVHCLCFMIDTFYIFSHLIGDIRIVLSHYHKNDVPVLPRIINVEGLTS